MVICSSGTPKPAPQMLTDIQCRKAKTDGKRLKLAVRDGLYLDVTKNGIKSWRMRYRLDGKDLTYTFGKYPDISLKLMSDELLPAARSNIKAGRKPDDDGTSTPKPDNLELTQFEVVAREWFALRSVKWAEGHAKRVMQRLEADVFPKIGTHQIANLTPSDILAPLKSIEGRGSIETAHKCRQHISMIFGYAMACEHCTNDPTQHLKQRMQDYKNSHFAAITDDKEALRQVLRAMHNYSGARTVAAGLKLIPWLLVRPGELRKAQWSDIDLDGAQWRYKITKTQTDHIVPLPDQAVSVLRGLYPYTSHSVYVFPNPRSVDKPMSENALQNGIKALGFGDKQTAHGFRATARTMLDEMLGFRVELIEHQLGHVVKDSLGRAYNRTQFLNERREMLQAWADWLEALGVQST